MVKKLILGVLVVVLLLAGCTKTPVETLTPSPTETLPSVEQFAPTPTPNPTPTLLPTPREPIPQGASPFAIATTKDGNYAYIGFDLSEVVFKVRLEDFTVEAVADLSKYFPIESEQIELDASEKKLFVHSATWQKLLVLDTQTMSVIHTIDSIGATGMFRSQYGPFLIIWDGGNTVKFINTETYAVTEFTDERIGFLQIQESKYDQNKWYVATKEGPGGPWVVGVYDYKAKAWSDKVSFPPQAKGEGFWDLKVLPNEQKAYVAATGGWYLVGYHSYGWVYSIDLTGGSIKVIPIDGGALCLEASPDSQRLYVGTGWPIPNVNNLLVLDTQSDTIAGSIPLGKTKYLWSYTQMNDLQIDPANPRLLYATSSDGNAFIKADLNSLRLANVLVLNQESYHPHFFVKRPKQATGYILIARSTKAFELSLDKAAITDLVEFPGIRTNTYSYDVAVYDTGRLLIAQGETVLEVDIEGMRLLGTHRLPQDIPPLWHFVLSKDQTRLYSISPERGETAYRPNIFLAVNTANFQVETRFRLEGGFFDERPYELPDGSKLYALGGEDFGPIVIHVIDTDNYTIQKTITFDEPGLLGIAAGPNYPFAYDSSSHTLFVGATQVVLAIDTDTDVIKKVIHLGDVAKAIGLEPRQLTYVNAIGLVYHPVENYLYIAHLDRSFVSIYDVKNDRFLPQVIPLRGYFPSYLFANDDYSKIYSLNSRSDSVSVIDVKSKAVEKVIDLHAYP